MKIKNSIYILSLILSNALVAQVEKDTVRVQTTTPKISVLDSIKKTFVKHDELSCIDSQWMKELSNQELSDEQYNDITKINLDQTVDYDLPTALLKERLKKLDAKSPFNIEYNQGLENVIKSLLKNRKKSYERLLAISEYYFPLFEDALAKYNIPIEVKYLAIVESALNPKAKSRVGATGLWQFMYGTGLQYNLDVNSYIDERSDPIKATEAACKYLSGMYDLFGDWDLVLASYNCGPGNVTKAIRRSGGQKNYWNIRKNLPHETAGYLPAFLATMYIFEYHKEHGINALKAPVTYFSTDTIIVKHQLSFKQISKLLDMPVAEIQFLNPSYKLDVIPFVANKKNYLRLPQEKVAVFTSNEDKIYYYAQYEENQREKPNQRLVIRDSINGLEKRYVTRYKYHKVRRRDNLGEIASKYGVSESDIKKWNKLKNNKVPMGRNLKIVVNEKILSKEIIVSKTNDTQVENQYKDQKIIASTDNSKPKTEDLIKEEKVISYKEVTKTHKVKKGENLSEIADKYDVSVAEIKKWNKLKSNSVTKGKSLKIISNQRVVTTVKHKIKKDVAVKPIAIAESEKPVTNEITLKPSKEIEVIKEEKVVTYKDVIQLHKVKKGDNIGAIANKYDVSTTEIKKWNKLKNNNIPIGKTIKIISKEKVVTTLKRKIKKNVEDKSDALVIKESREIKAKKSDKIDTTAKPTGTYVVQSGDNLSTIAKEYKISVNQLKEWNNLDNDNVLLGSKLTVLRPESELAADKKETKTKEYTVQKGDNIWSISKKFGVTLAQLKEWNELEDNKLLLGSKLTVSKSGNIDMAEVQSTKKKKNEKAISDRKTKLYSVKKGDSLFSISQKYQITVSDLKKWNGIQDGNIKPGMKLKISG